MNYEKMRDVLLSAQTTLCYLKVRYECDFSDTAINAIESRVDEIDNAVIELDAEKRREDIKTESKQHAPEVKICAKCDWSLIPSWAKCEKDISEEFESCAKIKDPVWGESLSCFEARKLVGLHCPYFKSKKEN